MQRFDELARGIVAETDRHPNDLAFTSADPLPSLMPSRDSSRRRGGRENVREVEAVASSRLRVRLANAAAVDEGAIRSLGLRGFARPTADRVHVLVGPSANEAVTLLRALIAS